MKHKIIFILPFLILVISMLVKISDSSLPIGIVLGVLGTYWCLIAVISFFKQIKFLGYIEKEYPVIAKEINRSMVLKTVKDLFCCSRKVPNQDSKYKKYANQFVVSYQMVFLSFAIMPLVFFLLVS